MLLRYLPREAATQQAVHGPAAAWSATEHLLAQAVDVLAAANWQRSGDKKIPRPKPIPRPGTGTRLKLSAGEIHARLIDQRRRRR